MTTTINSLTCIYYNNNYSLLAVNVSDQDVGTDILNFCIQNLSTSVGRQKFIKGLDNICFALPNAPKIYITEVLEQINNNQSKIKCYDATNFNFNYDAIYVIDLDYRSFEVHAETNKNYDPPYSFERFREENSNIRLHHVWDLNWLPTANSLIDTGN